MDSEEEPVSERRLAWTAAGLALVLYAATWSPVITWTHFGEDGPELEAVGRTLGVAHPTGYPLFTLLVRLTGLVLPPPWAAVNLVSLLAAAAAVGFLALAGARLAGKAFPDGPGSWIGGAAAGATLAVSLTWWRQAVIGEVYTLHVMLVAAVLALLFRGRARDRLLAAYLLGLGCAHHLQTVPFLLVVLAYLVLQGRYRPRPPHLLAFLVPLTLYGVLVVRAGQGPAFNWGNPETLRNLWWTVSGTPYRGNLFHGGTSAVLLRWLQGLGAGPVEQLGWVGAGLAVLGLLVAVRRAPAEAAALVLLFAGTAGVVAVYGIPDPAAYYLPAVVAASLAAGLGTAAMARLALGLSRSRVRLVTTAALAGALAAFTGVQAVRTAPLADARGDDAGFLFAQDAAAVLEPDALVIVHGDGRAFSLWYATSVLEPRADTAVLYDNLLDWSWYRGQVARTEPWVRLPEAPLPRVDRYRRLIDRNLGERPVYVTELPVVLETRYRVARCGPLFRILGLRATGATSSDRTGTADRSRSG